MDIKRDLKSIAYQNRVASLRTTIVVLWFILFTTVSIFTLFEDFFGLTWNNYRPMWFGQIGFALCYFLIKAGRAKAANWIFALITMIGPFFASLHNNKTMIPTPLYYLPLAILVGFHLLSFKEVLMLAFIIVGEVSFFLFYDKYPVSNVMLVLVFNIFITLMCIIFALYSDRNRKLLEEANAKLLDDEKLKLEKEIRMELQESIQTESQRAQLWEVTASISHEIFNPLTTIINASSLMDKKIGNLSVDEQRKYLSYIRRNSERIEKIVRSLNRMSKGQAKESMGMVEIGRIVSTVKDLIDFRTRSEMVKIIWPDEVKGSVFCHEIQICQVLVNLINNAIDACKQTDNPWVKIDIQKRTQDFIITVEDSGNGLVGKNVSDLFVPFYTTKKENGTGLGLSIARRIIQSHNSELNVRTEPNTCFSFSINEALTDNKSLH